VAIKRRRPPQRGHASTSMSNARRIRSAHAQRRGTGAVVGFALVPPTEPELHLLHRWLDTWRGIGDVVRGMARQS
jgi:hypothetical protein